MFLFDKWTNGTMFMFQTWPKYGYVIQVQTKVQKSKKKSNNNIFS